MSNDPIFDQPEITEHAAHEASIRYWSEQQQQYFEIEAWAPSDGGYVRTRPDDKQLCYGLIVDHGNTLEWTPGGSPLAALLKREWRVRQKANFAFRRMIEA